MDSFWEVRWGDVFAYGVLLPLVPVGMFLVWKLGRAVAQSQQRWSTHRRATRLLRSQRPVNDDRWGWLDWEWAFSQTDSAHATPYRAAARSLSSGTNDGPRLSPSDARACLIMLVH